MQKIISAAVLTSVMISISAVAEDSEPKYSIKECMKACFKGPLLKKVASGDANAAAKLKKAANCKSCHALHKGK